MSPLTILGPGSLIAATAPQKTRNRYNIFTTEMIIIFIRELMQIWNQIIFKTNSWFLPEPLLKSCIKLSKKLY